MFCPSPRERRVSVVRLSQGRGRQRFARPIGGAQEFLFVVGKDDGRLAAAGERHIEALVIGGPEALAGNADDDLIDRLALADISLAVADRGVVRDSQTRPAAAHSLRVFRPRLAIT
jgi:hypothetical protein